MCPKSRLVADQPSFVSLLPHRWCCTEFATARYCGTVVNLNSPAVQRMEKARKWPETLRQYEVMMREGDGVEFTGRGDRAITRYLFFKMAFSLSGESISPFMGESKRSPTGKIRAILGHSSLFASRAKSRLSSRNPSETPRPSDWSSSSESSRAAAAPGCGQTQDLMLSVDSSSFRTGGNQAANGSHGTDDNPPRDPADNASRGPRPGKHAHFAIDGTVNV